MGKRNNAFIKMKFEGSKVGKVAFGCLNNRGARNYQEDSFGFSSVEPAEVKRQGFTAVVCDGMGGLSGGARISGYAVSALLEMLKTRDVNIPMNIFLAGALRAINNSVVQICNNGGMNGGTTCAAVVCLPAGLYWCTAGDSRIYLARDGSLTALNEDTDYLNRLIEQVISGELSYDEAGSDEKKDALAQYIGCKSGINPDVNPKPFTPSIGDKILICSDGVYNALPSAELLSALESPAPEAAELIEQRVLSRGYPNQDNFTAIVLEFMK